MAIGISPSTTIQYYGYKLIFNPIHLNGVTKFAGIMLMYSSSPLKKLTAVHMKAWLKSP